MNPNCTCSFLGIHFVKRGQVECAPKGNELKLGRNIKNDLGKSFCGKYVSFKTNVYIPKTGSDGCHLR
jgi:hypothetical protein